jgi:hypothetical protein
MSIFGFSTEPTAGDFLPIIKYDARAGRIFRIDRTLDGREPVDITDTFAAVFDFENIETGWLNFSGPQPDFKLVKMGETLPVKPSENHKNGIRLMLKLHPSCAGNDKPVREFSTSAKAALSGIEKVYLAYREGKPGNGKLPIVAMRGSTPIKTGTGDRQSTNYVPKFEIVGWAGRPTDLVYVPRGSSGPSQNALPLTPPHQSAAPAPRSNGNGQPAQPAWTGGDWGDTPPTTGSTRMQAPVQLALQASLDKLGTAQTKPANLESDFG